MHHNCRSILSKDKLDNYEYFLDMLGDPFDIIGFTEAWLNDDTVNIDMYIQLDHWMQTQNVKPRGWYFFIYQR